MIRALLSCLVHTGIVLAAVRPIVTLETGILEGVSTSLNNRVVHKYLGVPFGKPPKRFGPPEPLGPSTRTFKAGQKGAGCIEAGNPRGSPVVPPSEDCLYLNVYAPAPTAGDKAGKTVLVWLFGGALQFGSGSVPTYDGTSFAANQDVVLVAINYRTNVFGFPGPAPGLPKVQQNLGFLDQRLALAWVQKNIGRFGGDPEKVTIFGESAVARSVDQLLLSSGPPQKPMFRAVIMQSGSANLDPGNPGIKNTRASENTPLIQLARIVGCDDAKQAVECLRTKTVAAIKAAQTQLNGKGIQFGSTDDGGIITALDSEKLRREHRVANVSLLIGSNADESRTTPTNGAQGLAALIERTFGNDTVIKEAARKGYAVGKNEILKTDGDAIFAITTDLMFTCGVARESLSSASAGYPTWRYLYNASFPNTETYPGSGAYHAAELTYVFGNLVTPKGPSTPEEISLSKALQTTWANFAKNPQVGPGWDKVGSGGKELGHFNYNGKLILDTPAHLDRNCWLYKDILDKRNKVS